MRREGSGGQRPQHSSSEQCGLSHKPRPYGDPRRVREGEEARAAAIREQEQRQKLSQNVAVKMASGVTIHDDEHFPKTRKEVRLLAYVCTRARTKDGMLLLPDG